MSKLKKIITYSEALEIAPELVIEILDKLRSSKSKNKDADPAAIKWQIICIPHDYADYSAWTKHDFPCNLIGSVGRTTIGIAFASEPICVELWRTNINHRNALAQYVKAQTQTNNVAVVDGYSYWWGPTKDKDDYDTSLKDDTGNVYYKKCNTARSRK